MPQRWPLILGDLSKELFEEFEKGEVYGKVLDYVNERHDSDTAEFYIELRMRLGEVVREMMGVLASHLNSGEEDQGGIAAKLEDGHVKVMSTSNMLDSNVVKVLFDKARSNRKQKELVNPDFDGGE